VTSILFLRVARQLVELAAGISAPSFTTAA
jgi:hypothetical protein